MPSRCAALAVLLLAAGGACGPAAAQPWQQAVPGVWAVAPASSCRDGAYVVTLSGDALAFRDRDGRVRREGIVLRRADGFVTEAVPSNASARTRRDYAVVGAGELRVRNLADGTLLVLTRCPDGDATQAGVGGAAGSAAFVREYFATWSSDAATALAFARRSYVDEPELYGRPMPRAAVLAEKAAFVARWPQRSYALVPGSLDVACDAGNGECAITGQVDWTCRSPQRGAQTSGSSSFGLRVRFEAAAARIVAETGAVTSREAAAAPAAAGPSGVAAPGSFFSPAPSSGPGPSSSPSPFTRPGPSSSPGRAAGAREGMPEDIELPPARP